MLSFVIGIRGRHRGRRLSYLTINGGAAFGMRVLCSINIYFAISWLCCFGLIVAWMAERLPPQGRSFPPPGQTKGHLEWRGRCLERCQNDRGVENWLARSRGQAKNLRSIRPAGPSGSATAPPYVSPT
jgi:hypothetical protein